MMTQILTLQLSLLNWHCRSSQTCHVSEASKCMQLTYNHRQVVRMMVSVESTLQVIPLWWLGPSPSSVVMAYGTSVCTESWAWAFQEHEDFGGPLPLARTCRLLRRVLTRSLHLHGHHFNQFPRERAGQRRAPGSKEKLHTWSQRTSCSMPSCF